MGTSGREIKVSWKIYREERKGGGKKGFELEDAILRFFPRKIMEDMNLYIGEILI